MLSLLNSILTLILFGLFIAFTIQTLFAKREKWFGFGFSIFMIIPWSIVYAVYSHAATRPPIVEIVFASIQGFGIFFVIKFMQSVQEEILDEKYGKKCPKCGKRTTFIESESSFDYEGTTTKVRTTTHYNADGDEAGYSETEYEVPETMTNYTEDMGCHSCGHRWTRSFG